MENFNYQKGSEWRKWDLHVHTPFTKLNNQYSAIGDEDVWITFSNKIEQSDVQVFGITDYFSIKNYFLFSEKFKALFPQSKKVFFPNIEFRIDSKNKDGDHIQLHVIFSNKQETLNKIGGFLTRLELVSTDDINLTSKYCIDSDLDSITYEKAMVTVDALEKHLKSDFSKREYLIAGLSRGYGSLRPGRDDSRGGEYAKELDKKCKLFFGSSDDTNFFLNKTEGREEHGLPVKPVLFGCDAHSFSDIDNRLGKTTEVKNADDHVISYSEITWIKADPTFEGLKQTIFEPGERVKIQDLKPEEKEGYYIINNVNFKDDNFTPEKIYLNQNLTVIIGGKSTGKSVLLRNIAKTIDSNEVSLRLKEVKLQDYEYNQEVKGFEVDWIDGKKNKKNESDNSPRKIIYIPQSYLNRLVDSKEDRTSIDDIIKNVIEQDEDVNLTFDVLDNKIRETEKEITTNIDDLFYVIKDIKNQNDEMKDLGDKQGVSDEIKKLEFDVDELKKKSGMTAMDISSYNRLLSEINQLKSDKLQIEQDINNLKLLSKNNYSINFDEFLLSGDLKSSLIEDFNILNQDFSIKWLEKIEKYITNLNKSLQLKISSIEAKTLEFNPLLEKARQNGSLKEKISRLENEKKKLLLILNQESKLKNLRLDFSKILTNLVNLHALFYDEYFNAKGEILKQTVIDGEITFGLDVSFRQNYFTENFVKEVVNLQKIGRFSEVSLSDYKYSDNTIFKNDVQKIIIGILNNSISLKNNYSQKEAITKLLQNWYIFDYKIKQNKDEISQMSPGKKSFVLLKLLVELDRSKCPILLDQPEDDLDNRSVYNDLVDFIKNKKRDRQIIIATHNPNLVVGADAECVIVANQGGEKTPNRQYDFEYVSGSLENTFVNNSENSTLYKKGIREHACDILEGGVDAFNKREQKYDFGL